MKCNWFAKWFCTKIRVQYQVTVRFKFMYHTRDDVSILSNWGYWYEAQVVHQSFCLPLYILCFTPQWQEWLALSQTCVLEVQECPVPMLFHLLKRTWRLINTCNLHTPAMCPSETSEVVPSSLSQRELRERRDFNQSSTNMKLFFPPWAFYSLASAFRPSCLFEL